MCCVNRFCNDRQSANGGVGGVITWAFMRMGGILGCIGKYAMSYVELGVGIMFYVYMCVLVLVECSFAALYFRPSQFNIYFRPSQPNKH